MISFNFMNAYSGEPAYLTKEGLEQLKKELNELKTVRKREVAGRIERAKELGDLSENAEYQDAKDEMAFMEGRIMELENVVSRAAVIDHKGGDAVTVGSTVTIVSGEVKKTYTIVGPNEANPAEGRISNESPLARALIGHRLGDEVTIQTPGGSVVYQVEKVI